MSISRDVKVTSDFEEMSLKEALLLFGSPSDWNTKMDFLEKATKDYRTVMGEHQKSQTALQEERERANRKWEAAEIAHGEQVRILDDKQKRLDRTTAKSKANIDVDKNQLTRDQEALAKRECIFTASEVELKDRIKAWNMEEGERSKVVDEKIAEAEAIRVEAEAMRAEAEAMRAEAEETLKRMQDLIAP